MDKSQEDKSAKNTSSADSPNSNKPAETKNPDLTKLEGLSQTDSIDESGALEQLPADSENSGQNLTNTTVTVPANLPSSKKPINLNPWQKIKAVVKHLDVYLLVFALVILVAIIAVVIAVEKSKANNSATNSTQSLNQSALTQLNNNDTQVGGNGQTLTIQADTVFGSNALIKGNLEVAGGLKVGGTLSLPGIQVAGASKLGTLNADTINIAGAGSVAGQLTVEQSLTVNGPANFSGPLSAPEITVTNLQINGDILISHHLVTIGAIPTDDTLPAVGSGGTSTVNGTDTSGTININTGTSASAGCLVKIIFTKTYASTPNVTLTMVATTNQTPPEMYYYVEKTSSGFTVCSQDTPSSASFGLNYIVID